MRKRHRRVALGKRAQGSESGCDPGCELWRLLGASLRQYCRCRPVVTIEITFNRLPKNLASEALKMHDYSEILFSKNEREGERRDGEGSKIFQSDYFGKSNMSGNFFMFLEGNKNKRLKKEREKHRMRLKENWGAHSRQWREKQLPP